METAVYDDPELLYFRSDAYAACAEDYIRTYVDGQPLLEFKNDRSGNDNTWPFNKKFYITLNLAWGGDWGGWNGVDESALPCTMMVDYVRVYKKQQ